MLEQAYKNIALYNSISINSKDYEYQSLLLNNINDFLLTAIKLCKQCDISHSSIQIIGYNVSQERAHVARSLDSDKNYKYKTMLADLMKRNQYIIEPIREDKLKRLIAGHQINPCPRLIQTPLCRPNTPNPEYKEEPAVEETEEQKIFWENL